MKILPRILRSGVLTLSTCLALSGCLNLKPAADRTRYFVLTAPPPGQVASNTAPKTLALGLRPVTLPRYLEDNRLAIRKSPNEIQYLDWSLWAEPLEKSILRVLGVNLANTIPTDQIRLRDWNRQDVTVEAELVIDRFEPDTQGLVTLQISWRILLPGGREIVRAGTSRRHKQGPPVSLDPEGSVAAMNALLLDFSRELAGTLNTL